MGKLAETLYTRIDEVLGENPLQVVTVGRAREILLEILNAIDCPAPNVEPVGGPVQDTLSAYPEQTPMDAGSVAEPVTAVEDTGTLGEPQTNPIV